jgi:hypothetical protein
MKDWKYILYVFGAIAIFVMVKLIGPKQFDWTVTYAHDDKDPYGTYALSNLLPSLFENKKISHGYKTLYELKDSLDKKDNIIIIASGFNPGKEDTDVLLHHVHNGASAFISAQSFYGTLSDTLNVSTIDQFFSEADRFGRDTTYLQLVNEYSNTTQQYGYSRNNVYDAFHKFDTTRSTVIARNDYGKPVTLRIKWGKGNLILNSTPMAFTNIYFLSQNNHAFISETLSYLPSENVRRTEYYHVGRMESSSPLRFILNNEALKWAYYITLAALLIFMLFEAKRKQRIIPIIKPLANTSLEFVSTIGNLYYQNGDHKNMAEKRITFLLEQIRSKYLLKTNDLNDDFFFALSGKSGKNQEQVRQLFNTIAIIQSSPRISAEQLLDLDRKIEQFEN